MGALSGRRRGSVLVAKIAISKLGELRYSRKLKRGQKKQLPQGKDEQQCRLLAEVKADREYRESRPQIASPIQPAFGGGMGSRGGHVHASRSYEILRGPGKECDYGSGRGPVVVLRDLNGDKGIALAKRINSTIHGKMGAEQGVDAACAACITGVAHVGGNHQMSNKYTETFNSRPYNGRVQEGVETQLKSPCFDAPISKVREICDGGNSRVHSLSQCGSELAKMTSFDHGQVLVHRYVTDGKFGSHLDQGSSGVALWTFGRSCEFSVCFSDQCQRHYRLDRTDNQTATCPHCNIITLRSGDVLIFDGETKEGVVHGVKRILDENLAADQANCPDFLKGARVSVQWRGRCAKTSRHT